jgi:formate hydrogenlyase subunit 6/NADH:ubiquinone oxidoreductase subunit I
VGVCKTGCIDVLNKEVDYLRCISCGNCAVKCPKKATGFSIEFPSFVKKSQKAEAPINEEDNAPTDNSRRAFITSLTSIFALGFLTRAFGSENLQFDGGLAKNKKAPVRDNPIIPPGAQNIRNFRRRCTACQRCVSLCPNNVLVPSGEISKFMQPHLSFERGFCRPECVRCSRVCPTGAIKPLTQAQKAKTQIGVAVFIKEFCINSIEGRRCARCAHRCPSNAITMVPQSEDSSRIKPEIDKTRCIGCGACEFYCPASPNRAIFVDGVDPHKTLGV